MDPSSPVEQSTSSQALGLRRTRSGFASPPGVLTPEALTPGAQAAGVMAPGELAPGALLPGDLPPGPLTTAELAAAVPGAAGRKHYRRIWHGMYRREDQTDDLGLRSRALSRTFPDGVLRGRSAALMWGDDSVPGDSPPEIWLPSTRRARAGRVYRYGMLPGHAITERDGLRVTTPLRTCRDLVADLDFEDAVVSIERMCAMVAELPAQLRAAVDHPSGRRTGRFHRVVNAVEPRSTSAMSTRARLVLRAAGCGDFGHGHQVQLNGGVVELPLADPAARCAVFAARSSVSSGRTASRHQSRLQGAGWTVIIVRDPTRGAVTLLPRPGTVPETGPAGIPRRAAGLLAARWPAVEMRLPAYSGPADPHGLWGSGS